jgi:shikimate kinase
MNIFLIGFRCTGKSSVGKALAHRLAYPFKDADEELVRESGICIADMVAMHGWPFFREQEQEIIHRLSRTDNHVIATGGGAILNPDNIRDMKDNGFVIWLKAKPETIRQRIVRDKVTQEQRPALTDKGLIAEIEETLAIRNPLYEQASDICVDTDDLDIGEIVGVLYLTFQKKC